MSAVQMFEPPQLIPIQIMQRTKLDPNSITVLCAEDNAVIGMDLLGAIDEEPDMECVGLLLDANSIVDEVKEKKPKIVLMDLTMPGRDPLDALAEISSNHPDSRTIAFSGHSDPELVDRVVEAGAWGYIVKCGDLKPVIDAIRKVAEGEFALGVV